MNSSLSSLLCVYVDTCLITNTNAYEIPFYLKAKDFAVKHGLQFFDVNAAKNKSSGMMKTYPYILAYQKGLVSILQTEKGSPGAVSASFLNGKMVHRLQFGGGKGQMIAKAVGLNRGVYPSILDATAGLGRDAFVLASLGCQIILVERSPVISELLFSALEEAKFTEIEGITGRMKLIHADSTQWLVQQSGPVADVIYLDPMYPHRDKSSLVKKEMRLFQALVGEDLDDSALLSAALEKARYRVVVKRPRKGEMIEGRKPSLQLMGKSCRYDIYALKRIEDLK